jgi:O-acetyl-ADP-ribose deacetylase (regulator of RNase III)
MAELHYLKGDATNPIGDGAKLIIHVCNNVRAWGKGFVLAISRKWPQPEYHFKTARCMELGDVQFVQVDYLKQISVCNMWGQDGIYSKNGIPPIRYEALKKCFKKVLEHAKKNKMSIHCPRIGCGLAGGKWEIVEQMLKEAFVDNGIDVYVYNLKG